MLRYTFVWLLGFTVVLSTNQHPLKAMSSEAPQCLLTFQSNSLPQAPRLVVDPAASALVHRVPLGSVVAPDGQAFVVVAPENNLLLLKLYRNEKDANPVAINPPNTQAQDPAWSPDGRHIAFSAFSQNIYNIYVANADGTNPINITKSQHQDQAPSWSPDSKRIAFRSDRDPANMLWVIDANGQNIQQLPGGDAPYVWSPNGKYIAATRQPSQIDIIEVATKKVMSIHGDNVRRFDVSWSPDSQWFIYLEGGIAEGNIRPGAQSPGQSFSIMKSKPDLSGKTKIGPANVSVREASWSRSNQIAFIDASGQVYLMNADGSQAAPVKVSGAENAAALAWTCQ